MTDIITNTDNPYIKISNKSSKKNLKYYDDQLRVLAKLNTILNITDTNNTFIMYELENNEEQQKQILDLETDIKKYFSYSTWSYFNAKNKKKNYMSLVRSIYKTLGYDLFYKSYKIKNGDKLIHSQIYHIIKKNI
jgi:hypothetical protein